MPQRMPGFIIASLLAIVIVAISGLARYSLSGKVPNPPRSTAVPSSSHRALAPPSQSAHPYPLPTEQHVDWRVYRGTGWSFKFPAQSYLLREYHYQNADLRSIVHVQLCPTMKLSDCGFPTDIFSVRIYDNRNGVPLDQWIWSENSPLYGNPCWLRDHRTQVEQTTQSGLSVITYAFVIDEATVRGVCKGSVSDSGGYYKYSIREMRDSIVVLSVASISTAGLADLEAILATFRRDDAPHRGR